MAARPARRTDQYQPKNKRAGDDRQHAQQPF
jgi:hypothetical protein